MRVSFKGIKGQLIQTHIYEDSRKQKQWHIWFHSVHYIFSFLHIATALTENREPLWVKDKIN